MRRQPGNPFNVQVVRRLIQEQEVVVPDQRRRQGDPPALATAEGREGRFPRNTRHQAVDDVAHPRIPGRDVLLAVPDDGTPNRQAGVEGVRLVERADVGPTPPRHPSRVRLQTPGQQAEQGRFSLTIAADDADAVALADAQAQRVEDHAGRELEMQGFVPEQVRHRSMLPARSAPLGTTQVTAKTLAGDRINPREENDREDAAGPSEPVHGQLSYLQVPALDVTQSAGFYEKVFGWHVELPHPSFGTNGGEVLDVPSPDR